MGEFKTCKTCGKTKVVEEFLLGGHWRKKKGLDPYMDECRECYEELVDNFLEAGSK